MEALKIINNHIKEIKESNLLEYEQSGNLFEDYLDKKLPSPRLDDLEELIQERIQEFKEDGYIVDDEDIFLFYLFKANINWNKKGFKNNESWINPINGGFSFNSVRNICSSKKEDFWKNKLNYSYYDEISRNDVNLLENLKRFDNPTPYKKNANYTTFFTCLKKDSNGKIPNDWFFFDSHFIYQLPFNNYKDYLEAMVNSASVECWQFFYIDPEELINRNLGKSYFTIFLDSYKIEGHSKLHFNPEIKADRLDIIHEYLERCVTTLPLIFPEMDFTYHKDYFEKFNALYLEARKK